MITSEKHDKWIEEAIKVKELLNDDLVHDYLLLAISLRDAYLAGKKDSIHKWNNTER